MIALAAAACQTASEQITEQVLEQPEGVENVDIDPGSGVISVEMDGGSFGIGVQEIPSGFPVPFPDGYEVVSVFTSSDVEGAGSVMYAGDRWDEIVGFYDDWTGPQQGEWQTSTFSTDLGDGTAQRRASWGDASKQVGAAACHGIDSGGLGAVCVTAVASGG